MSTKLDVVVNGGGSEKENLKNLKKETLKTLKKEMQRQLQSDPLTSTNKHRIIGQFTLSISSALRKSLSGVSC